MHSSVLIKITENLVSIVIVMYKYCERFVLTGPGINDNNILLKGNCGFGENSLDKRSLFFV